MINEIYIARRIEYSGGKIIGLAGNEAAATVLVFIIRSLAGKYSDVVCMNNLSAEKNNSAI